MLETNVELSRRMESWWLLGAKFCFHILVEIASNSLPTLCWRQMPNCPGGEKGRVAGRWLLGANLMSRPFLIWNRTALCTASRALPITLKWQLCTVGNTLVSWTALLAGSPPLLSLYWIVFLFWGQSTQILVNSTAEAIPHNSVFGHNCWLGGRAIYESQLSTNWKEKAKKPTKKALNFASPKDSILQHDPSCKSCSPLTHTATC